MSFWFTFVDFLCKVFCVCVHFNWADNRRVDSHGYINYTLDTQRQRYQHLLSLWPSWTGIMAVQIGEHSL